MATGFRWSQVPRGLCAAAAVAVVAGLLPAALPADAVTAQPAFYTDQAPYGEGTAGQRVIALTFDDGPGPFTPQVLSVLEQYHVPATFFEIGVNVASYPQYTDLVAAAGYPVEDHTWTHPDLETIPVTQFDVQINQTQDEIRSLTGRTPTCVRPPYDDWDATVLGQIAARGLTTMSYSVDPRDWSMPGVTAIVAAVVGAAFPGAVVDMHDGGGTRSETVAALPQIISQLQARGYSFVSICAPMAPHGPQRTTVHAFATSAAVGPTVTSNVPLVGMACEARPSSPAVDTQRTEGSSPNRRAGHVTSLTRSSVPGYWLAGQDGGVFSFGDAAFYGSMGGQQLAAPVVGIAPSPGGGGYWEVGADGGVFSFGDAGFFGSMGGQRLDAPITGIAATPDGGGYWEVGADGGVFTFGDAGFYGSMGGQTVVASVVGIAPTPDGRGYWEVSADGGVFTFGDAGFYGSMGGQTLDAPIMGLVPTPDGQGYWEIAADGGVFTFGDAVYAGSEGGTAGDDGYFGLCATGAGLGYLVAGQAPG